MADQYTVEKMEFHRPKWWIRMPDGWPTEYYLSYQYSDYLRCYTLQLTEYETLAAAQKQCDRLNQLHSKYDHA